MRFFRLFLLHFQDVIANPGRSVIWILIALFNSLFFMAFMRGIFQSNPHIEAWTVSSLSAYYFVLIFATAVLQSHPEVPILRNDIELGEIDSRLLKPFSYYWQHFYHEIPYRLIQGIFGLVICIVMFTAFGAVLSFPSSGVSIVLGVIIFIVAYFICFTFKMIVGIIAFLTTDIRGINELIAIVMILLSGVMLPINLLPDVLQSIALSLPFAYITYYPVMAILGQLSISLMLQVIGIQLAWLIGFSVVYRIMWKKVLENFASVGK